MAVLAHHPAITLRFQTPRHFPPMQITLNGENHELPEPVNLRQLLEGLALPSLERGVAVAEAGSRLVELCAAPR